MRAPRSLCFSGLYDDGSKLSSLPAGLPSWQISLPNATPLSFYSSYITSAVQSHGPARLACPTAQSAAAASVHCVQPAAETRPTAAASNSSFAAAPALCYSPAEPALKEPLGDVLRRAGKRCYNTHRPFAAFVNLPAGASTTATGSSPHGKAAKESIQWAWPPPLMPASHLTGESMQQTSVHELASGN
jgi:hypothetical protein